MRKERGIATNVLVIAVLCVVVVSSITAYLVTRPEDGVSPELPDVPVVPLKPYKIAFSNAEMLNPWRWCFAEDFRAMGEKYAEYGCTFTWTEAMADAAKQVSDCETLLAGKPDVLILSPVEKEALNPVAAMCESLGIPLLVIDREIVTKPGPDKMYFSNITMDFHYTGAVQALYALTYLKEKYGEYKGNIVEIQGIFGASVSDDEYEGVRAVLKHYPDVKIIATDQGWYSRSEGRKVAEDFLMRFEPEEIDYWLTYDDAIVQGVLEAWKERGVDWYGAICGKNGIDEVMELIAEGKVQMSSECTPYYAWVSFEAAINYLNGEQVETYVDLPIRDWDDGTLIPGSPAELRKCLEFMEGEGLWMLPPEWMLPPGVGSMDVLSARHLVEQLPGWDELVEHRETGKPIEGIYDLQNT